MRYAGLAKKAIGVLMGKTFNKAPADAVAPNVAKKAGDVTHKVESVKESKQGGGTYSLTLFDNLLYAKLAFKGGSATVDTQMRKAMNKIVATINRKMPDGKTFFSDRKLPTPFPEVVQKKR